MSYSLILCPYGFWSCPFLSSHLHPLLPRSLHCSLVISHSRKIIAHQITHVFNKHEIPLYPFTFPLWSFQSMIHNRSLINIHWVKTLMKSPCIPIINLLCSTLSKCFAFYLWKVTVSSLWTRKNQLGSHSPFCSTLSINVITQKQSFRDTKRYKVFTDLSLCLGLFHSTNTLLSIFCVWFIIW